MMSHLDLSSSDSTVSLPLAIMKRRKSAPRSRLHITGLQDSWPTSSLGGEESSGTEGKGSTGQTSVLKDSAAESDGGQSTDDALLDTENKESSVKKNKLRSILRVLRDNTPCSSSESGDNLEDLNESTDGNHLCSIIPVDDGTFSTLDRRVRRKKQHSHRNSTNNSQKSARPKSDSFNMIPALRGSLCVRGRSKVPTFSFLEEMQGSVQLSTQRESSTETLDSMDDDERSDASFAEHYRLVDEHHSDNEHESHQSTPPPPALKEEESILATSASPMPATVVSTSAKPSDYTRYPVEVSLHRINVVDIDVMERESKRRALTLPSPTRTKTRSLALNLPVHVDLSSSPSVNYAQSIQGRSKSVGDMEDLESEEEVILVRSPMIASGEQDNDSRDDLDAAAAPYPGRLRGDTEEISRPDEYDVTIHRQDDDRGKESLAVTSLDFLEQPRPRKRNVTMVRVDEKEERGEKSNDKNMSKWRSLDNLLTGSLPRK